MTLRRNLSFNGLITHCRESKLGAAVETVFVSTAKTVGIYNNNRTFCIMTEAFWEFLTYCTCSVQSERGGGRSLVSIAEFGSSSSDAVQSCRWQR